MCDDSVLHRFNAEEEINQMVKDISIAQQELSLVCVIGAGVSISQGYPDWNHYVLELIDYWRFHLDVIVGRADTERKEVNRRDLIFLEWLRDADYTNKRKVDLVNYIVEQYSEAASHDKSDSENIYSEVVNECEHFIFLKLPPIQVRNQILDQLVKMHTTFVTTNYDEQIENSIIRQLAQKPVRYADITKVPTSFQIDSVIHIHGMPLDNIQMFVSSSASYSKLYLGHTKLRQTFQKFFSNRKKIVFLFIGCSMQEEEVLSLLEIPRVQLVKYAFMKYNSTGNSDVDKFQNRKIADFYWAKRLVKFIWFGDKFLALPTFIESLVKRVNANQIPRMLQSEELNQNLSSLNAHQLLPSINQGVNTRDYYLIDSIFKQTDEEEKLLQVVEIAMQSDLINKKVVLQAFNFPNFWNSVDMVFQKLSKDSKVKILTIIAGVQGWNRNVLQSIVNICLSAAQPTAPTAGQRARFLMKHLGTILKSDDLNEVLTDSQLRCLWLIEQLRQDRSTDEVIAGDAVFDFDDSTYRRLLRVLNILSKNYYLSEFKLVKKHTVVGLLYFLIRNQKMTYLGKKIFPPKFYQNLVIQKILINLDLKDGLFDNQLAALLSGIDFKQRFLGTEMNKFVVKHPNQEAEKPGYYIDGIISGSWGSVTDKPFLAVSTPQNAQQVDALINQLSDLPKKTEADKCNPLIEHNLDGQNKELLRSLNSDDAWADHPDLNEHFLTTIFQDYRELIVNYRQTITTLLSTGLVKEGISQDLVMRYIRLALRLEIDIFDGQDNDFLETAVKCFSKAPESEIYKYLFTEVQPEVLVKNHEDELFEPGQSSIDLNRFINTSVGNYYLILEVLESDAEDVFKSYAQFFKRRLSKLSNPLRSYLKGRFFRDISKDDPERQNEQAFIGYAHRFQANRSAAEYYADAVAKILTTHVKDRFLRAHIGMAFAVALKPTDSRLKHMAMGTGPDGVLREVFDFLLSLFVDVDHPEEYNLALWLEWYLEHDEDTLEAMVKVILHGLSKGVLARKKQLVEIIVHSTATMGSKIPEYVFYSLADRANGDPKKLQIIVELIQELLSRHAIQINAMFVKELKQLIVALKEESLVSDRTKLLETAKEFFPPADYESLCQ